MFYQFLKILVGFTLRIFFKKIFITGIEHIKSDKAQLVASNHPNGFLEPLIMACFFPKDLHFLVRGDVFDNPFLRPILISTHQIPIFRFRDGFSKLRENSNTMDESIQVLLDKKNLLIFAEGGTESIKKLRPLQKGIARIAFQTLEKDPNLDLEVLPVGINFTYPARFNEEVMMRVNHPIKVKPFFEIYLSDKNKGVDALLSEIYNGMKVNIIHLENQNLIHTFEKLAVVKRINPKNPYLPVFVKRSERLDAEKNIAILLDDLPENRVTEVKSEIKGLETKLNNAGLIWNDLVKSPLNLVIGLVLFFGFMPALLGFSLHFIPIITGYYFTKAKVKQKEFKGSILMVITLLMMMVQYLVLLFVILFSSLNIYWFFLFVGTGFWLRFYYYLYKNTIFTNKNKFQEFQNQAIGILQKYSQL